MATSESTALLGTSASEEQPTGSFQLSSKKTWARVLLEGVLLIAVVALAGNVLVAKWIDPSPPPSYGNFVGLIPNSLLVEAVGDGLGDVTVVMDNRSIETLPLNTSGSDFLWLYWSVSCDRTLAGSAEAVRRTKVSYNIMPGMQGIIRISHHQQWWLPRCSVAANIVLFNAPKTLVFEDFGTRGHHINLGYQGPPVRNMFDFSVSEGDLILVTEISSKRFTAASLNGIFSFLGTSVSSSSIHLQASRLQGLFAIDYDEMDISLQHAAIGMHIFPNINSTTAITADSIEATIHKYRGPFRASGFPKKFAGAGISLDRTSPYLEGYVHQRNLSSSLFINASNGQFDLEFTDV